MKHALDHLIDLQEVDNLLDALEKAKGDLPSKVRALEDKLAVLSPELVATREKRQAVALEKRKLESDIAQLQENKKKYEEQLYSVTTNKEYDAVTLEIENAIEKIDTTETALLEHIEEEEKLVLKIEELEKELAQLQEEHTQQSAELQKMIAANAEKQAELSQKREGIAKQIKIEHRRLYERIRANKSGLAVVSIVRSACGGCYTNIPPQRTMEIREAGRLITCESCGRILVWHEVEETVAVG